MTTRWVVRVAEWIIRGVLALMVALVVFSVAWYAVDRWNANPGGRPVTVVIGIIVGALVWAFWILVREDDRL